MISCVVVGDALDADARRSTRRPLELRVRLDLCNKPRPSPPPRNPLTASATTTRHTTNWTSTQEAISLSRRFQSEVYHRSACDPIRCPLEDNLDLSITPYPSPTSGRRRPLTTYPESGCDKVSPPCDHPLTLRHLLPPPKHHPLSPCLYPPPCSSLILTSGSSLFSSCAYPASVSPASSMGVWKFPISRCFVGWHIALDGFAREEGSSHPPLVFQALPIGRRFSSFAVKALYSSVTLTQDERIG
ncbi:hypothetical protein BV22DRAFT_642155 [Leucogyrophana mollusca]|uniref:Uncharacterized protein n=1 Tax=Leucogyrophana mollusca TaxID=85980 RepID=A0ACB8BBN6_9AGAM|nr:hypothetical protein BV22DRAFT_642155 [Leucogyrophana mollusca]